MRVCFATSELHPFAKTGGLADVSAALPRYLHREGHDVRLFMPLYGRIRASGHPILPVDFLQDVPVDLGGRRWSFSVFTAPLPRGPWVYFVHCPDLYARPALYTNDPDESVRFALLSHATLTSCQRMAWAPDIVHCNDWHTALIPLYLKTVFAWDSLFRRSRTVLTLHNLGYQGVFPAGELGAVGLSGHAEKVHQEDLRAGRFGFLKTGLLWADAITTVSPTYAREIQMEEHGMGLHDILRARRGSLVGILNGVDYEEWSPEADPHIPFRYSVESLERKEENKKALLEALGVAYAPDSPVLGVISRLAYQKGMDLLFDTLPELLGRGNVRFVALGVGERRYEEFFERLEARFPGRTCFFRGHDNRLAHWIEAGSDFFLMPSRYEPCGLNQMYSLRYGTVPVVRRTGGLADTVRPFDPATGEGTGFVFEHFTNEGLRWALDLALRVFGRPDAWERLRRNAMSEDFSWERQGRRYLEVYADL